MALTINWATSTITIPVADLSLVSSNVYTYDTSNFHTQVGLLQDSEQGITYDDIISYNSPYSIVGVTYAPKIELINGFKVQFEDGLYSVTLTGSNNNLFDIGSGKLVRNNVQVIPTNSAGLQTVATGSGVTSQDVTAIANAVDNILLDDFANISISASGLTAQQAANIEALTFSKANELDVNVITEGLKLSEVHSLLGLDSSDPMVISETEHLNSALRVTITKNTDGSVTLTRL